MRRRLGDTYRYIMIDEYQDTNLIQAELVRLLAATHRNVMAVGDDAQSIYSFRGANFRNIMDFPEIFPGAHVVKLEENYRSLQGILDVANEVISRAADKYTKVLAAERRGEFRPLLVRAQDEHMQSRFVAQRILELREQGVELGEIAVLFRSASTLSTWNWSCSAATSRLSSAAASSSSRPHISRTCSRTCA